MTQLPAAGSIIVLLRILPDVTNASALTPLQLLDRLRAQVANASSALHHGNLTQNTDPSFFVEGGFCRAAQCGYGTCVDSGTGYTCSCNVPYLLEADCTIGLCAFRPKSICSYGILRSGGPTIIYMATVAVVICTFCAILIISRLDKRRLESGRSRVSLWAQLGVLHLLEPLVYVPLTVLFAMELERLSGDIRASTVLTLRVVFAAGVVLPVLLNTLALARWTERMLRLPDFNNWYAANSKTALAVLIAAAVSSTSVVKSLGSRACGLALTRAPLRLDALASLGSWTVAVAVCGDVPRLGVQVAMRMLNDRSNNVVALYLASSVLKLWVTIVAAILFGLLRKFKPKYFTYDKNRGAALPDGTELAIRQVPGTAARRDICLTFCHARNRSRTTPTTMCTM
jgi:hypothetical protein